MPGVVASSAFQRNILILLPLQGEYITYRRFPGRCPGLIAFALTGRIHHIPLCPGALPRANRGYPYRAHGEMVLHDVQNEQMNMVMYAPLQGEYVTYRHTPRALLRANRGCPYRAHCEMMLHDVQNEQMNMVTYAP